MEKLGLFFSQLWFEPVFSHMRLSDKKKDTMHAHG